MKLRPATPADADAIRAVADAAWWDVYPGVLGPDRVETALDRLYDPDFLREVLADGEELLFVVAERGGEVVGFASAAQTFADEVELYTLYVHPDHQQEGVGTALLASVADSADEAGAGRLRAGVLSGNHVARAFFEGHGFERVETVQTEVGGETHPEDILESPVATVQTVHDGESA
ncbi:GNAT family N-acetyltransferase [Halosegnis sp.]|uniref:GNAT family N-acetyltransferase n=1 Tax=Halosegnis sp. TaxID=2864959 RepID=UPI0035D4F068